MRQIKKEFSINLDVSFKFCLKFRQFLKFNQNLKQIINLIKFTVYLDENIVQLIISFD